MSLTYSKVPSSEKEGHQIVEIDDQVAGEVWLEAVPSSCAKKRRGAVPIWRWFAKCLIDGKTIGRGPRLAVLTGGGYVSKEKAAVALGEHHASVLERTMH